MIRPLLPSVVVLVMIVGCSETPSNRPAVAKAGGVVRYQGKPLADAVVVFTNHAANASAYAKTNSEGKFQLTTFGHEDGAIPGKCKVGISKVEVTQKATKPEIDYNTSSAVPTPPEEKRIVPEKYGNPETSGFEFEVTPTGPNNFTIEIK